MEARLGGPPPEEARSIDEILESLRKDVIPYMSRCEHPGYLAFIPASGTWPGALGDFLASALSIYTGSWMDSAGPSQVELTVLDWFKQWIGYPTGATGILVSGGSAANMTALACARETLLGAMSQARRRLRLRPGPLLHRSGRPHPRVSPEPGPGPSGGRPVSDAAGRAGLCHGG